MGQECVDPEGRPQGKWKRENKKSENEKSENEKSESEYKKLGNNI